MEQFTNAIYCSKTASKSNLQQAITEKFSGCTIDSKDNILHLTKKSQLNKIIVNNNNKPDFLAINIYWDTLRSWYFPLKQHHSNGDIIYIRKLKTQGIYLKAEQLAKTYGVSKETIRKKLVKLENLGLIQRSFQHTQFVATDSFNQRVIYVLKNTPHFFNPYGIDLHEIHQIIPQTNAKYIQAKHGIVFNSKNMPHKGLAVHKGIHKTVDTKELIEPFSKEKDRSISKFENKDDLDFSLTPPQANKAEIVEIKKTSKRKKKQQNNKRKKSTNKEIKLKKTKTLEDSIESMTEQKAIEIRKESGRDFSLNGIKKLLLSFLNKGFKPLFHSNKGEISWIAQMLRQEMRQTTEVNKTTFIPKINLTPEEIKEQEQEQYLSKIEYSLEVSPEWHLKKKLAAVLERTKAYEILKSYRSLKIEPDGRCKLLLDKGVELTNSDKEIILNQVKATHEKYKDGNYQAIDSMEIVVLARKVNSCGIEQKVLEYKGIWGEIRKSFISLMRTDGEGIDRSWLSMLDTKIDEKNKVLTLVAKGPFFRDWIKDNYLNQLSRISAEYFGFTIDKIIC